MNRKLLAVGVIVVSAATMTACHGGNKAQKTENKQQQAISSSLVNNQPLPGFNYSQLRQNLKEIETAEANGVQTTTFFFNQGVQNPISSCPSIGAPIPTTDQLSNPNAVQKHSSNGGGNVVIGQMDPTGVYTGDSAGTYVMCVDATGKAYANYWEGYVQTVFGNAVWDDATHTVKLVGAPSFDFSEGKK